MLIVACGGGSGDTADRADDTATSGDGGSGGSPTTGATTSAGEIDIITFDVEWAADAAVLDDAAALAAALVSADHAEGRFVFDPEYQGLVELDVGRSALLGGIGVFRVTGRQQTIGGVEITVEPGELTDVIENGRITFESDAMAHPGSWEPFDVEGGERDVPGIRSLRRQPSSPTQTGGGKLTYAGTIAGFATTLDLTARAQGGFTVALTAKKGSGTNVANLSMSGTVEGLRTETDILIESHSLKKFTVKLLNLEGTAEVHGGGAQIGVFDVPLKVPAKLAIPLPVGPIPFYVSMTGGIQFSSTLVENTTALVNGTTSFKGGVGAAYEDGSVRQLATFDRADVAWQPAEHVGTVTAGIGLLLDFPIVEFGIGHPGAAGYGAEFKFRSELVSNFEVEYGTAGNVPVITGNCTETKVNFTSTVSGSMKMLGLTVATDPVTLFTKLGDPTRRGNAC